MNVPVTQSEVTRGASVAGHPVRCYCGAVEGVLANPHKANRAICYCTDCQAFAHFLGNVGRILDEHGGSDIVQTLPKNLTFTRGLDAVACIRLTEKGAVRWYTRCCRTPIGNTVATPKWSFVGLLHTCLTNDPSLDYVFGPVSEWVNTGGAKIDPKPKEVGKGKMIAWFMRTTLKARFNGDYLHTPFFRRDTGAIISTPHVLTSDELTRVRAAVRGV